MIDLFLRIGSTPNWISPLWAFVQDLFYGRSTSFLVPYGIGWSGRQIEKLLKSYGITMWGLMVVHDTIIFEVRRSQAQFARYLLEREGIPVQCGPLDSPPSNRLSIKPAAKGGASLRKPDDWLGDPVGKINKVIDRIGDL